jgi:flagellar motor switch protein FliN
MNGGDVSAEQFLQNLQQVLQPYLGELGESLSAALNRGTRVQLGEIRPITQEELQAEFPDEVVLTHATFVSSASHDVIYLIPLNWAAIWADLMVMGDGSAQFDPTQHLDAIKELLNQVSGSLAQYLSSTAGFPVKINVTNVGLETIQDQGEGLESYFGVDFNIRSQDLEPAILTLLLSPESVDDLQRIQPSRKAAMDDRPPRAVLEEEFESNQEEAPEVRSARFEDFGQAGGAAAGKNIDILMDLELPVIIELGRTSMFIRDILDLGPGSIVELSKLSGEPVDLFVNDKKFAQGEVVVIDENFGIRITDLVKVEDRIRSLR